MKKERKLVLITGCRTYGRRDLGKDMPCDDPECSSCASFKKAFKEEVMKWSNSQ